MLQLIMKKIPEPTTCALLSKIVRLNRYAIDIEMRKLELSRTQWQTLIHLSRLGACSQKVLLNQIDIDPGHLTRVLEQLEKDNYILRIRSKQDKRCLLINLTDYSKEYLIPKMQKIVEKSDSILLKDFNKSQKESIIALLKKIETNIESHSKKK